MKFSPRQYSGFTLIELIVTLSIAAIVMTVGVPSFNQTVKNNRIATSKNEFLTSVHLARSEAVKRSSRVIVCGSSDQSTCNTANWESGWIVFADNNADGDYDQGTGACLDSEDCLLYVRHSLNNAMTLRGSAFSNVARIQYNARGIIDSSGTFTLCDDRGESNATAININSIGHVMGARDSNADGIVNSLSGANVVCS